MLDLFFAKPKAPTLSVDLPAGGGVPPTKQEQLREQPFLYVSDVKSLPRPEEALPFQQQHYALVPQHEELPSVAYWGRSLEERLVAMSTARYEMASHQMKSLPSAMSSYRSTKSKFDERTPGKEWTIQTAKKNPPHQIGWQPFDSRQALIGLSVLLPIPPSGREAKALNKQVRGEQTFCRPRADPEECPHSRHDPCAIAGGAET